MKTLSIEELRVNHERAMELLARAVAKEFPVGAPVWVKWGNGEMLARVAFHPHASAPCRIAVIRSEGIVHWRDYRDLRLIVGGSAAQRSKYVPQEARP